MDYQKKENTPDEFPTHAERVPHVHLKGIQNVFALINIVIGTQRMCLTLTRQVRTFATRNGGNVL